LLTCEREHLEARMSTLKLAATARLPGVPRQQMTVAEEPDPINPIKVLA
jgi:hypothetical protein